MKWAITPGTGWYADQDGVYVTCLDDTAILVLSGTAALVWESLLGRTTEEAIADIADQCEAPIDQVRDDVYGFAGSLAEQGLLSRVEM